MRNVSKRRRLLLGALAAGAAPRTALAQGAYPDRPITFICPFTPGGTTDLAARSLADAAGRLLGRRLIVENRPGAGGALGATYLATNAKPDGYTITQTPMPVFRHRYMTKSSFNPLTDLAWIIGVAAYQFGIVVRADAPWKTWQELVAYAKANPGRISYSTSGIGSSQHVAMDELGRREGVNWVMVPYKGQSEGTSALRSGEVQVFVSTPPWEMVDAGHLRVLITLSEQRPVRSPSTPTLKELNGFVSNAPWGIAAPKGVDPAIIRLLHDTFRKAMDDPSFATMLQRTGLEAYYMSSEEYARRAVQYDAQEKAVVDRLGLAR